VALMAKNMDDNPLKLAEMISIFNLEKDLNIVFHYFWSFIPITRIHRLHFTAYQYVEDTLFLCD